MNTLIFLCGLLLLVCSSAFIHPKGGIQRPTPSFLSAATAKPSSEYDVIVVGSGIGGLCAASMLSLYGKKVAVLESHTHPGGAAHGYSIRKKERDFHFDTGPSFFSGLSGEMKRSNPLRTVLEAIGETVDCVPYKSFGLRFPEGDFVHTSQLANTVLRDVVGDTATKQWERLMNLMQPLAATVDALPTIALRGDVGVALTSARFLPSLASGNPLNNLQLTRPFSNVIDRAGVPEEGFLRNWLDLLCFCLSGLPSEGTITAEMAMMLGEFYEPTAVMDCPKGGAASIVKALVRGIEKYGGEVHVKSHVDRINIEQGRATSVSLASGETIRANQAVISNLSVWDLFQKSMIDISQFPESFVKERQETPVGKSFMHLHVGFRMDQSELRNLQAHYMYIDDWSRGVDAEDNAVLLSIPSVHDDSLAPEGYGVLHIYSPATEQFERWSGLDRKSVEYKQLKAERSEYLWTVLEKIIPDIRDRATIVRVGTPLTHQRFLRRHQGSYGPAIRAGEGSFPFPTTPITGLLLCGDSCFPGIGVPAVAGSGLLAANSISLDSIKPQLEVLERLAL